MIIRDSVWERIRDNFTLEEKDAIRQTLNGRILCPAASSISIDLLPNDLQVKLFDILEADKKTLKVGSS